MKDRSPAFPINGDGKERIGLTIRDYFAAKAMQSLMSECPTTTKWLNDQNSRKLEDWLAENAYSYADAMLKQRKVDTEVGS